MDNNYFYPILDQTEQILKAQRLWRKEILAKLYTS